MLIPCPHCGARNVTEFTYGGAANLSRPAAPADTSDAQWADYVYMRDNPCGPHDELWQHSAGCRRWIAVCRDTRTHDVISTAVPGKLPPQ